MLNAFKHLFSRPPTEAEALVQEFAREIAPAHQLDLERLETGVKFDSSDPELQCRIVAAMVAWFDQHPAQSLLRDRETAGLGFKMTQVLLQMLKYTLPLGEGEVIAVLDWYTGEWNRYNYRCVPQMIKMLDDHLQGRPAGQALQTPIKKLIKSLEARSMTAEVQRWILRLKELAGDAETVHPLAEGDVWAGAACAELRGLDPKTQRAWAGLLIHCLRATGSAPSKAWIQKTGKYLDELGPAGVFPRLLRWFPLVDEVKADAAGNTHHGPGLLPVNAGILKGLVWACARSEQPEMARALAALAISAYRKIPGTGPRAAGVGNACFWALANMPGEEGAAQLSILKSRIKLSTAQKALANSLRIAAQHAGISAEDIEEMSAPAYGLQEVGLRRDVFGEVSSELRIDGSEVEQHWVRQDGRLMASAPRAVREQHPKELKEITQAARDMRRMLAAQRDRIDNLYLDQRKWSFAAWQARYLDHPLIGTIARRLIWKFSKGDQAASGIWWQGRIVGRNNEALDWLDDSTSVELWHPIHAEPAVVLGWRQWLLEHEIRQPFKQAHREVYLLTDAERNTRSYSNRYSAHILRQHQFNSLCAARGWKNSLRLMVDGVFPPAARLLPAWGLRAEYWIESIGDQYGVDTNATGTYLYLTTDQVRFYHIDALMNHAHAAGGGYGPIRWNGAGVVEPLALEDIPPLVFSEIMRDVDMFVGVASIGNDPSWVDGGAGVRFHNYWQSYSFGELTESAKTRKQVLETVIPHLKIAGRCTLLDKYLVVKGDLRTYNIHLGSGNILMEPNDQYLCIVPARGQGTRQERLFVPFEGDQTLAIILSKAFLLAEDKKITDPSITRQLQFRS